MKSKFKPTLEHTSILKWQVICFISIYLDPGVLEYFENLIPIVIYPKKGYRAKAGDEKRKLFSFLKDNNFKDIQD